MPSFQVLVLGFADGFLSPFPDSLPQLFLRCLPHALAFGLSPSDPLPFVRFSSGSGYLAFLFFRSFSSRCRLTAAFPVPPSPLSLPWLSTSVPPGFPCFPSIFSTWLFCRFPFVPPSSAPAAASLVLAFLRFLASPSFPAFSVPLPFVRFCFPSGYSAFCFFLSVLPASASQRHLPCCLSAFASLLSPFFPARFPVPSFPVYVLGFL